MDLLHILSSENNDGCFQIIQAEAGCRIISGALCNLGGYSGWRGGRRKAKYEGNVRCAKAFE